MSLFKQYSETYEGGRCPMGYEYVEAIKIEVVYIISHIVES